MQCWTKRRGVKLRKKPYKTKRLAIGAMKRTSRRKGLDWRIFSAYRCPECKKWHFGRKSPLGYEHEPQPANELQFAAPG
jgi:hypothetical protein